MPPTPLVILEFDDGTPCREPPFTYDGSMWSFRHDFNLHTRTAAEVFRAMHEAVGGSVFRGYPPNVARATRELLHGYVDAAEVTWVSASEVAEGDRAWLPAGDETVERGLRLLFETVEAAARQFGHDRVRLVFAFV